MMTEEHIGISNTCPMGSAWREWDLSTPERVHPSDPGDFARVQAARAAVRGMKLEKIEVSWSIASDDARYLRAPRGAHHAEESPSHLHADFTVNGHRVHIDRLSANKHSPGRSYVEIRIFVDGILAGRGGSAGSSLGGGGNDLPAIALLGDDRALTVDGQMVVTLWERECAREQGAHP